MLPALVDDARVGMTQRYCPPAPFRFGSALLASVANAVGKLRF